MKKEAFLPTNGHRKQRVDGHDAAWGGGGGGMTFELRSHSTAPLSEWFPNPAPLRPKINLPTELNTGENQKHHPLSAVITVSQKIEVWGGTETRANCAITHG